MKNYKFFPFVILAIACNSTFGQGLEYRNTVKLNVAPVYHYPLNGPAHLLASPSFSAATTKGRLREFELSRFFIGSGDYNIPKQNLTIQKVAVFDMALRYQYTYILSKKERIIQPTFGISALAGFYRLKSHPLTPLVFPVRIYGATVQAAIVPGLQINTKKRLYFTTELPVNLLNALYSNTKITNPHYTFGEQRNGNIYGNYISGSFRIGTGLKF